MNKLTINTSLEKYILIDNIIKINDKEIAGGVNYCNAPAYAAFESLAQLAAMHARWLQDFKAHAALLKINKATIAGPLDGNFLLTGTLDGRTGRAFRYSLQASADNGTAASGEFIIARVDYDNSFKREILEEYYRKLFACLTKK